MPVVDETELQNWLISVGSGNPESGIALAGSVPGRRRFRRIAVEHTADHDCPCGKPHLAVISPEIVAQIGQDKS